MRISCEVDNGIHCKLLEDSCYTVGVAQIACKKVEVGKMLDGVYVALGRAIIEDIKAEYRILRSVYLKEVPNEPPPTENAMLVHLSMSRHPHDHGPVIDSHKSCAPSNQDGLHTSHSILIF